MHDSLSSTSFLKEKLSIVFHNFFPASSTPCYLSPHIIPRTPTTVNSSQQPFGDDTTITSIDDSSTLIIDTSSQQILNNSSRISAIRELIETEQRYVNDLRTVANEFIKPLSTGRILNDYEIEQLFSNWFSLIACNSVFLSTLQEQVQYREHVSTLDDDVSIRTPRSASMSNIAMVAQVSIKYSIQLIYIILCLTTIRHRLNMMWIIDIFHGLVKDLIHLPLID
jgi:hypothetical protein